MCTVTYIPQTGDDSFVLSSNRDEVEFRPTLPPEIYATAGKKLAYPKDEKAGGSWIAMNENGKVCCLLNGGINAHKKQDYHTLSRGIILLEFSASDLTSHDFFASKELKSFEPFTLVSLEPHRGQVENLTEFIWDGQDKYFRQLDKDKPYIWSSVTLYNEEQRKVRKAWFTSFLQAYENQLSSDKIVAFHSGEHTKDDSVNVIMQREGGLKTVSITQVKPGSGNLKMKYYDLLKSSFHELAL